MWTAPAASQATGVRPACRSQPATSCGRCAASTPLGPGAKPASSRACDEGGAQLACWIGLTLEVVRPVGDHLCATTRRTSGPWKSATTRIASAGPRQSERGYRARMGSRQASPRPASRSSQGMQASQGVRAQPANGRLPRARRGGGSRLTRPSLAESRFNSKGACRMTREAIVGTAVGGPYSPAVIGEGRFVFVSGQGRVRDGDYVPGGIEERRSSHSTISGRCSSRPEAASSTSSAAASGSSASTISAA